MWLSYTDFFFLCISVHVVTSGGGGGGGGGGGSLLSSRVLSYAACFLFLQHENYIMTMMTLQSQTLHEWSSWAITLKASRQGKLCQFHTFLEPPKRIRHLWNIYYLPLVLLSTQLKGWYFFPKMYNNAEYRYFSITFNGEIWLQNLPEQIIKEPVLPSLTLTFGFSRQFPLLLSIPLYIMFQSFVYDLKCLFIRWGYKISLELDFYSMCFFIPVCKTVVYPFFYMWFTAVFWKMPRLSLSELHACLNNWHAWMINSNINLSMVFSTVQSTGAGRLSIVLLEGYWINHRSRTDRERASGTVSSSRPVIHINVFKKTKSHQTYRQI